MPQMRAVCGASVHRRGHAGTLEEAWRLEDAQFDVAHLGAVGRDLYTALASTVR
jgi:hypothetical protein